MILTSIFMTASVLNSLVFVNGSLLFSSYPFLKQKYFSFYGNSSSIQDWGPLLAWFMNVSSQTGACPFPWWCLGKHEERWSPFKSRSCPPVTILPGGQAWEIGFQLNSDWKLLVSEEADLSLMVSLHENTLWGSCPLCLFPSLCQPAFLSHQGHLSRGDIAHRDLIFSHQSLIRTHPIDFPIGQSDGGIVSTGVPLPRWLQQWKDDKTNHWALLGYSP